jgi:hypothetical protein
MRPGPGRWRNTTTVDSRVKRRRNVGAEPELRAESA